MRQSLRIDQPRMRTIPEADGDEEHAVAVALAV